MALLQVNGVGKRFGGLQALQDVSLTIAPGETVGIIGPNGAGKTTLFNIVAGEEKPDSGTILLGGQRIDGMTPDRLARRGVARTFQNGRVFGNLSVLENVLLGAHIRLWPQAQEGSSLARPLAGPYDAVKETLAAIVQPRKLRRREAELVEHAKKILALFGERLLPRLHAPAYTLSYANRRRTELARALALEPQLLLLDEPTAGMNPTETDEMMEIIQHMQQRGQTILLIEHKLDLVTAVSDRVAALNAGRILVEGAPAVVRADPRLIDAYIGRSERGPDREQAAQPSPLAPEQTLAPRRQKAAAPASA